MTVKEFFFEDINLTEGKEKEKGGSSRKMLVAGKLEDGNLPPLICSTLDQQQQEQ